MRSFRTRFSRLSWWSAALAITLAGLCVVPSEAATRGEGLTLKDLIAGDRLRIRMGEAFVSPGVRSEDQGDPPASLSSDELTVTLATPAGPRTFPRPQARLEGRLLRATVDSLIVEVPERAEEITIPLDSLAVLEVRRPRTGGQGAARGLALGLGIGAMVGALSSSDRCMGCDHPPLLGAIVVSAIAAPLGLVLGWGAPGASWKRVSIERSGSPRPRTTGATGGVSVGPPF